MSLICVAGHSDARRHLGKEKSIPHLNQVLTLRSIALPIITSPAPRLRRRSHHSPGREVLELQTFLDGGLSLKAIDRSRDGPAWRGKGRPEPPRTAHRSSD